MTTTADDAADPARCCLSTSQVFLEQWVTHSTSSGQSPCPASRQRTNSVQFSAIPGRWVAPNDPHLGVDWRLRPDTLSAFRSDNLDLGHQCRLFTKSKELAPDVDRNTPKASSRIEAIGHTLLSRSDPSDPLARLMRNLVKQLQRWVPVEGSVRCVALRGLGVQAPRPSTFRWVSEG